MSAIDDYLSQLPAPQQAALARIRHLVHALAPEATEVMSYGMPGFKHQGKYLLGFAAFKDHLSLFPTSQPIPFITARLSGFTHFKGTIQFSLAHQLPEEVIQEIVHLRLEAIEAQRAT